MKLLKIDKIHPNKYWNFDKLISVVDKGFDKKGRHRGISVRFVDSKPYEELEWNITYEEFINAIESSNPVQV